MGWKFWKRKKVKKDISTTVTITPKDKRTTVYKKDTSGTYKAQPTGATTVISGGGSSGGGSSGGGSSGGGSSGGGSSGGSSTRQGPMPVGTTTADKESFESTGITPEGKSFALQKGTGITPATTTDSKEAGVPVISRKKLEEGATLGRAAIVVDEGGEKETMSSVGRTQFVTENINLPYQSQDWTSRSQAKFREGQQQIETAGAFYDYQGIVSEQFQKDPESFRDETGFTAIETPEGTQYGLSSEYFEEISPRLEEIGKGRMEYASSAYRTKEQRVLGETIDFTSGIAVAGAGLVEFPINLLKSGTQYTMEFDDEGKTVKPEKFRIKTDYLESARATPGAGYGFNLKEGLTVERPENVYGSLGAAAVAVPLLIAGGMGLGKSFSAALAGGATRGQAVNIVAGETLSNFGYFKIKPGVVGMDFTKSTPYKISSTPEDIIKLGQAGKTSTYTVSKTDSFGQDVKLTYGTVKTTLTGGTSPSIKTLTATNVEIVGLGENIITGSEKFYSGGGKTYSTALENVPTSAGRYDLRLAQQFRVLEGQFWTSGKITNIKPQIVITGEGPVQFNREYSFLRGSTFTTPGKEIVISDSELTYQNFGAPSWTKVTTGTLGTNLKPVTFGTTKVTPGASATISGTGEISSTKTRFWEVGKGITDGTGVKSFQGGGARSSSEYLQQLYSTQNLGGVTSGLTKTSLTAVKTVPTVTTAPAVTGIVPSIYGGKGMYDVLEETKVKTDTKQIIQPKEDFREVFKPRYGTRGRSDIIPTQITRPAQKTSQKQIISPIQTVIQKPVVMQPLITPTVGKSFQGGFSNLPQITPPGLPPPIIPKIPLSLGKKGPAKKVGGFDISRAGSSYAAAVFDVRGKETKGSFGGMFSGLEIRPLTKTGEVRVRVGGKKAKVIPKTRKKKSKKGKK